MVADADTGLATTGQTGDIILDSLKLTEERLLSLAISTSSKRKIAQEIGIVDFLDVA